jgi:hypothetical protein
MQVRDSLRRTSVVFGHTCLVSAEHLGLHHGLQLSSPRR